MAFVGFSKAHMLSPEGRCKSFSNSANGFVRSEGCVVFVLKDLEKAKRDGDDIKAVVLNTGANNDGKTEGLPLPSIDGQASLLSEVYKKAHLSADEVDYIETHGTGTNIGDPVEVKAIWKAIASNRTTKLPIGSVKSNLGHLESASGIVGALKAILCIKNKIVPPTIHCKDLNPDIDFANLNIEVTNKPHYLDNEKENIIVGVNSFGCGGANAHVILSSFATNPTKQPIDSSPPPGKYPH